MFGISFTFLSSITVVVYVIAIVLNLVLAYVVFMQNRRNATNIIYVCLSLCMTLWLTFTFATGISALREHLLLIHRFGIFTAALLSTLFFLFAYVLPDERLKLPRPILTTIGVLTALMMICNISPFAFTGLEQGTVNPIVGWGIIPFSVISTVFSFLALGILVRKYFKSEGAKKKQLELVLLGIFFLLILVIITVLLPIVFFNSLDFISFAPLYSLVFLAITAYAITRYQLFNVKLLLAQAFTAVIAIILFGKIFSAQSYEELAIESLTFLAFSYFGILLVRNVKKEIAQREKIERLAKELESANERLKELDKMKSEFVSIASHQLRSPLTAIRGYASMLLEGSYGKLTKKAIEAIERIQESSRYMALSVEDYLNVSRIEAGNMKYEMDDFNMREMAEEVVEEVAPTAEEKGLKIEYKSFCKSNCTVHADIGKTRQVLLNLIDNAIKYTKKGSITVITRDNDDNTKMCVTVRDTGVGMSKETIDNMFQKFVRAKNANHVNVTGTGLGLFVAKRMVDKMNGRLWAESPGEGKGSSFHFELPLK